MNWSLLLLFALYISITICLSNLFFYHFLHSETKTEQAARTHFNRITNFIQHRIFSIALSWFYVNGKRWLWNVCGSFFSCFVHQVKHRLLSLWATEEAPKQNSYNCSNGIRNVCALTSNWPSFQFRERIIFFSLCINNVLPGTQFVYTHQIQTNWMKRKNWNM